MYIRIWDICVVLLLSIAKSLTRSFRALLKKSQTNFENSVDIVFAGCYIYHDRRSTIVGATADVATTDVTKTGRR